MAITTTSCNFHLLEHTKTNKPAQNSKPLVISEYTPDPTLCVILTLKECIRRTEPLQKCEKQLFVSYIQPHKAVSKDTISRWSQDVLKLSGIDIAKFTVHSTRAAATRKANSRDVPLDVILSMIGWGSAQTFHKF